MHKTLLLLVVTLSVTPAYSQIDDIVVLDENTAITMALANYFELAKSRYEPAVSHAELNRVASVYDAQASLGYYRSKDPLGSFATEQRGYNGKLSGVLTTGTGYELNLSGDDLLAANSGSFSPFVSSAFSVSLSQPLLSNFGGSVNRSAVRSAKLVESASYESLERSLMDTVSGVLNAYYDLSLAKQNVVVAIHSQELAQELLDGNQVRVKAGTMAESDLLLAESALGQREEQVIIGRSALDAQMGRMKMLISQELGNDFESLEIDLVDPPPASRLEVDIESGAETALRMRPEVSFARLGLGIREESLKQSVNLKRPSLNLEASYGMRSEASSYRSGINRLENGDDAYYSLGLVFSRALRNRSEKADVAISRIRLEQARINYDQVKQAVQNEVYRAGNLLRRNWQRLEISQKSLELSKLALDAEQRKLEFGNSTTLDVLNLQNSLAAAEARVNQSIADYNKSVVGYQTVIGTILEKYGVEIESPEED